MDEARRKASEEDEKRNRRREELEKKKRDEQAKMEAEMQREVCLFLLREFVTV